MNDSIDPAAATMGATQQTSQTQGSEQSQTSTQTQTQGSQQGATQEKPTGKWLDQVSEAHRSHEFLKGKEKIDDLVLYTKAKEDEIKTLQEKVAKLPPDRPKEGAKPEEIAAWRKQAGLPEAKEAFSFKREGELKDVPANAEMDAFYQELFFNSEVPVELGQKLWNSIMLKGQAMVKAYEDFRTSQKADGEKALRADFKGDYEPNMKLIGETGKALWTDDVWKEIEASGLGNKPSFVKPLLELGKEFGPARFIKSNTAGSEGQPRDAAKILYPNMK